MRLTHALLNGLHLVPLGFESITFNRMQRSQDFPLSEQ